MPTFGGRDSNIRPLVISHDYEGKDNGLFDHLDKHSHISGFNLAHRESGSSSGSENVDDDSFAKPR